MGTVRVRCYCECWYQAQIKMDEWMMIGIYDDNNNIRKALFSFLKVYR